MRRTLFKSIGWKAALLGACFGVIDVARAGEVRLKNGVTLYGHPEEIETLYTGPRRANHNPTTVYPIMMVSTPLQRYYVPMRQKESVNRDLDLSKNETFTLPQQKRSGAARVVASVGDFLEKPPPFDEYGRRTVKLAGGLVVIQGVTEITPRWVKVSALNYSWETALATSSVPVDVLDPMLRRANPADDADHRMKIVRFYIEAELYGPAQRELEAIGRDFPAVAATVNEVRATLREALAQELLGELKLRQRAGQHQFVYDKSRAFPVDGVPPGLLRDVRELTAAYDARREQAGQIQAELGELQAALASDSRFDEIGAIRAEISEKLHEANLDRLEAFRKLAADSRLGADERLALAISGWVLGSANAVTELDQALRYWQARHLVIDYLRTADDGVAVRDDIRTRLEALEGISVPRVAQLLPLLPPPLDAAGARPGAVARIAASASSADAPVTYHVMLPPEYHPDQSHPLLVVLHGNNRSPQQELAFWAGSEEKMGPAQRHGYIVIAPEYLAASERNEYDYSALSHRIMFSALRDACLRFQVDADRIYLAGHQQGANAAFDVGFSHPDRFAGVIPIAGVSDRFCQFYWENARQLPLYVVSGELDGDTVSKNAKELMRMMQHGFNLIFTEYIGTGPDSFYSEIHKLFDWMERHRRPPQPKKFEFRTMRTCDRRFAWCEFDGLPAGLGNVDWTTSKPRVVRPMIFSAMVTEGNTIIVKSGAERNTVWLSPEEGLVDFDKRLVVRINGNQRYNAFLKPDLGALLESARKLGDRQRLYWGVLEF